MEDPVMMYVLCAISLGLVGTSFACNGYQLKTNYIRNCHPQSIMKVQNLALTLDNDCNIIPSGCVVTTKRIETAQAHVVASKPPLPTYEGDADLCEELSKDGGPSLDILSMFNFPKNCPINPTKVCASPNNKINISKFKNRLVILAGTLTMKSNVTHSNGVSCTEMSFTLEKPRRG